MKPYFDSKKIINTIYQSPSIGQFALEAEPNKTISWDHCREQFLGKMNNINGFFFSHLPNKGKDIAFFVHKFELILSISLENMIFSTFAETDKDHVLWISPSKFWFDCLLKKSLFTLVIRSGLNYDFEKNNFDDCLFGEYVENKMIRETKSAFKRFMYGFTKFTGILPLASTNPTSTLIRHGWHSEFNFADNNDAKRKLVAIEEKKDEYYFGFDFLWN